MNALSPEQRFVIEELIKVQYTDQRFDLVLPRLVRLAEEEEETLKLAEQFLQNLETNENGTATNETNLVTAKEEEEEQEIVDDEELAQLSDELLTLLQTQKELEEEEKTMSQIESYLEQLENEYITLMNKKNEVLDSLKALKDANERKLETLTRSNILNETFFIWHEGLFGTINGLRLGSLPNEPVEWRELNAAWGFAALLLDCIAKSVGFDFFVWRVSPRGSQSVMVNVQNSSQTLNLHCNSSWFFKSSFNAGISAFADCIDELGEFAKRDDPSIMLPYPVSRSTISGLSLHYSSSIIWTRAMKYLLTNLKWLEIWVVKRKLSHDRLFQ